MFHRFVQTAALLLTLPLCALEIPINRTLDGWIDEKTGPVCADTETRLSPDCSLRLENGGRIQYRLTLEPGAQYVLTFYTKGRDIVPGKGEGARIMMCGSDRKFWSRFVTGENEQTERGTYDWRKGTVRFAADRFQTSEVLLIPAMIGPGTVWYDKIEIRKLDTVANSFRKSFDSSLREFAFYPLGIGGFFNPGQPITMKLELDGTGTAEYSVNVKNFDGSTVCRNLKGKVKLPGAAEIKIPGQKKGYYIAEADVFVNGRKSCYVQSGIAVSAPFGKRDPFFRFGFGSEPDHCGIYKRVGAGAISLKFLTHVITTREPRDLANANLKYFAPFLKSGDYQLAVCFPSSIHKAWRDPRDIALGKPLLNDMLVNRIEELVRIFASATGDRVKEWSIQTEIPSQATIDKYAKTWTEGMFNQLVVSRMVSRIVRKVNPGVKIWVGGNNIQKYTGTIEKIVMTDLINDFDGYFIDGYTGQWDIRLGVHSIPEKSLRSFYEEASALSVSLGKGPNIRNEEIGYSINYGAAYDKGLAVEQANLTTRALILTKSSPVLSFELFRPGVRDPSEFESDDARCMTTIWKPIPFGKKVYDAQAPLPGGAAYATAAHELAFVRHLTSQVVENCYACFFTKPDGSTLAAVWNTEKPLDIKLELNQNARLVSMVGAESVLKKGGAVLRISESPVYITTREPAEEFAGRLKEAFLSAVPRLKVAAKRYDMDTISLYINGPGDQTIDAEIRGDGTPVKQFKVLPGVLNTCQVPFCRSLEVVAGGVTYPVSCDNSFLSVPRLAEPPVFDGSGRWTEALTAGELRVPNDVYPKEALQAERCHFKTDFNPNGHDIAADYHLAYDEENFYIAVKVDDPVHVQTEQDGNLWRGDCIQFAFSVSDVPPKALRPVGMPASEFTTPLNFCLGLTPKGPECRQYAGNDVILRHFRSGVVRKGGDTFYEIAVPWSELGVRPNSGKAIRFSLLVFDKNSEALKEPPYWLALTEGLAGGADASLFRLLVFGEEENHEQQ